MKVERKLARPIPYNFSYLGLRRERCRFAGSPHSCCQLRLRFF